MSKKNGVMDWYFQIYNLFRILKELPDFWEKYVDWQLHLPENIDNLKNFWREYKNELCY